MSEQGLSKEVQEIWTLFKETDRRFKETERLFRESIERTEKEQKEAREQMKRLNDLFTGQWGKLMEALVRPGVLKLFSARGIQVNEVHPNVESFRSGGKMEVDLLLTGSEEVVVIEVKTTLKVPDVHDLLEDLDEFFDYFSGYRGYHLYGAVAALTMVEGSDRFAYKQGLFVLKMGNEEMIEIANDEKFKPKDFGVV